MEDVASLEYRGKDDAGQVLVAGRSINVETTEPPHPKPHFAYFDLIYVKYTYRYYFFTIGINGVRKLKRLQQVKR